MTAKGWDAPGATGIPAGTPKRAAASAVTVPIAASGATSGGSSDSILSSTKAHAAALNALDARSSTPVPLASPHSIARRPVNL